MINTSGRRKAAVARVYLKEGNGTIIVNKKPLEVYFPLPWHQSAIQAPMTLTENGGKYDVQVNVCGGGYYPHRYSVEQSYMNPSVYCKDLYKLINHINNRIVLNLVQDDMKLLAIK